MPAAALVEPRAVTIASHLVRFWGDLALGRADEQRRLAEQASNHARADLFLAVRTIIADRDKVFSRSRWIS